MTKKIYENPTVATEEFDLSQSIAGTCDCIVRAASVEESHPEHYLAKKDFLQNYTIEQIKHVSAYHKGNNEEHVYEDEYAGVSHHDKHGNTWLNYFWS